MVSPVPTACSTSRWMPSWTTIRCSATGITIALKHQCYAGGDVEVGRVLDQRLPGHAGSQQQGVEREGVDQREHAVLVEQHEADQDHAAGEQVGDVELRGSGLTSTSRRTAAGCRGSPASARRPGTRRRGTPASWRW